MAKIRKKKTVARRESGKRKRGPQSATELVRLQRKVAFDYCRYGLGWPTSIEAMLKALGERKKYAAQWRAYSRGDHDPSTLRLQKMEKAVPGTVRIRSSDFWMFLQEGQLSKSSLLRVIHRLPFELAARLINGPDSTGEPSVRLWIDDEDYFCVQALGTLDAVAALLATAELQMLEADYPGKVEEIARAFHAATRLLVRLSLEPLIRDHISDIFEFLKRRYPSFLDDRNCEARSKLIRDYELVLMVIKYWEVVPQKWPEQHWFLSIADRKHFDAIVIHARRMLDLIENYNGVDQLKASKPIAALLVAYREIYALPQGDAWFADPPYPVDRLRGLDELLSTFAT